jgi:hypothetical protein
MSAHHRKFDIGDTVKIIHKKSKYNLRKGIIVNYRDEHHKGLCIIDIDGHIEEVFDDHLVLIIKYYSKNN